jgi:GNAT superfamily N-acetyltransferase
MHILPYRPEFAEAFDRLNRAWIEQYFAIEPFDNEVLRNPETYILKDGGELWFAVDGNTVLGCCALLKLADGMFEFTKLGVDEKARGLGIARALLRHCAERAKELGAHTLRIYTSTKLIPANTLYKSEGFLELAMSEQDRARYKRGDIMYDLPLAA